MKNVATNEITTSCTMPNPPLPPWRLKPVSGTCRWIDQDLGLLRINYAIYTVFTVPAGFRLVNWSNGRSYDIDAEGKTCTCPSYVWDHCPIQAGGDGRCKHIAALRILGLLPDDAGRAEGGRHKPEAQAKEA